MASAAITSHRKLFLHLRKKQQQVFRGVVNRRRRQPLSNAPAPVVTQAHYRRAADAIIEEDTGDLLWANGIDKMLRFTPYAGLLETAGVIAPTSAIFLSGRGIGAIVGTFYAYSRFVDRDGNFSSLSPISNVYTPVVTSAVVSNVTNASPMVVTTTAPHGLGNNQIVDVEGVAGTTSANGIWVTSAVTATTFAIVNIDQSNSVGNGVYNSGGAVTTGVSTIQYLNVPTTTEVKVVRRQVLRNKDGVGSVFYIDIDTTDLTSPNLSSNTTSQSLSNPVSILDINGNTLTDKTPPPHWKKFIAQQQGRVFAAGIEPYAEGSVSLTNGSPIVTGIGTEWGPLTFPGRLFEVAGGNLTYTIQSVQSKTSLTLAANYTGTTDPYAYYSIFPSNPSPTANANSERRTIYWSAPGQPEAFPLTNQLTMEEDPGAGEFTGLMSLGPYLFILAQHRIYQFSYVSDPALDGYSTQATQRGCVNNRCWIKTEDASFMMDTCGFHIFSGNNDVPIGSSEVQDLFRPRQTGPYKINWTVSRNFHAVFDPGECIIRWFVTMAGWYAPRHAIAYQVRLRRWWIEEYAFPVGASCLGRINGKPQVFLGSDAGRIFALNASPLDGLDPSTGTVRGTVTTAGLTWLADSTANFPTANVVNNPVDITQGAGKGQRRIVVSVSGTKLNVDQPWTTGLDTTSVYQIGGIKWRWKSGWHRWTPDPNLSHRAAHVTYSPTVAAAEMHLRVYQDFSKSANTWAAPGTLNDGNGIALLKNDPATDLSIDTTKANGYVWQRMDAFREEYTDAPRFMAVEIGGVTNAEAFSVRALRLDGVQG